MGARNQTSRVQSTGRQQELNKLTGGRSGDDPDISPDCAPLAQGSGDTGSHGKAHTSCLTGEFSLRRKSDLEMPEESGGGPAKSRA